jgi:hypothetical protein
MGYDNGDVIKNFRKRDGNTLGSLDLLSYVRGNPVLNEFKLNDNLFAPSPVISVIAIGIDFANSARSQWVPVILDLDLNWFKTMSMDNMVGLNNNASYFSENYKFSDWYTKQRALPGSHMTRTVLEQCNKYAVGNRGVPWC